MAIGEGLEVTLSGPSAYVRFRPIADTGEKVKLEAYDVAR